jgi:nucleoside-diphosphate-sugar epimerase
MRIFVVGASGAIGTRLVPQLIERDHEVIGTGRSPESVERVRALGANPVALDLLDAKPSPRRSSTRRPHLRMRVSPGTSTAASRRPTGFARRARTTCWPQRARRA